MGTLEEVKVAVEAGTATASTVTTLAGLLGLDERTSPAPDKVAKSRTTGPGSKTPTARRTNSTVGRPKNLSPVVIREDTTKALSGRDRYALATHAVNHGLRLLSSSVKSRQNRYNGASSPAPDASPQKSDAILPRPLQPRSCNASPVRSSPRKESPGSKALAPRSPNDMSQPVLIDVRIIAQCTQQGFAFLLPADFRALGLREMPQWQLESGLLSLVGSLTSHNLEDLAVRNLRLAKQRLETGSGTKALAKSAITSRSQPKVAEKPSLARLLHLDCEIKNDAVPLGVAISYYQHVIKLALKHPTTDVLEELSCKIVVDLPNGPVDLIIRQAKATKDFPRATKHLENLSQLLIGLRPSVTHSTEDTQTTLSPEAVFRLQTTGLKIQKLSWKLAKHQPDISRELLEPFIRATKAFVRSQDKREEAKGLSELLSASFKSIGPFDSREFGVVLFAIHDLLCSQAAREGKNEDAQRWAELMVQDCVSLEGRHARTIAAHLRVVASFNTDDLAKDGSTLAAATDGLESKITGNGLDYDILVEAISSLSRAILDRRQQSTGSPSLTRLLLLGTTFCQRYARSYPGRNTKLTIAIVNASLRLSRTTEDLLSWITRDSAAVFLEADALKGAVELATTRPLLEVWSASQNSLSFSRVVNTLLIKVLRQDTELSPVSIIDDKKLVAVDRGILLEWQLQCAADLASRTKYHEPLKKLIPEILKRLVKIYDVSEFPIRRARSATIALGIREAHPHLIPPHILKIWQQTLHIDPSALGQDVGLVNYIDDLSARHTTFELFWGGRPTVNELKPNLTIWRRLIMSCNDKRALHNHIDDPMNLRTQLESIAAYLRMLGDDGEALSVHIQLARLDRLLDLQSKESCTTLMVLAQNYSDLGYSGKTAILLEQYRGEQHSINQLHHKILYAEHLLAIDQLDKCRSLLDDIKLLGAELSPDNLSREYRRPYEMLYAKSWLLCSELSLLAGVAKESLSAAKRAVQVLNGIWSSIERACGVTGLAEPGGVDDKAMNGLAKGISKLQLTSAENDKNQSNYQSKKRGAAFWPIIPVLMKALLHMSNVYIHHGLFKEADYYSIRAISIAESVGSTLLLSRVRSHRCRLMTLAVRIEDAELCIAQDTQSTVGQTSLASVERCCAKAEIKAKEGDLQGTLLLYGEAEKVVDKMNSIEFLDELEGTGQQEDGVANQPATSILEQRARPEQAVARPKKFSQNPVKTTAVQPKPAAAQRESAKSTKCDETRLPAARGHYSLTKLKRRIALEKAMISLQLGKTSDETFKAAIQDDQCTLDTFRARLLRHRNDVRKATDALETNVTLSLLAESTLSCPGLATNAGYLTNATKTRAPTSGSKPAGKTTVKSAAPLLQASDRPYAMLVAARTCLAEDMANSVHLGSTVETHLGYSWLSNASLLASAFPTDHMSSSSSAIGEAMSIDHPRIRALQLEKGTIANVGEPSDDVRYIAWPEIPNAAQSLTSSRSEFQRDFIDILPAPWTAVSLCLSEDGRDLFIARYRSGAVPLTLKLPFARHKLDEDEDIDGPAFDYKKGKAELQDIIETSNYTCHNPGDLNVKGTKSKWWKERQELDRRLHELLVNIENIWFGGFKSIFSLHRVLEEAQSRFRANLDQILARYLPSRNGQNKNSQNLVVDDQVLELFISLGSVGGMLNETDEPVTDLLYFVVDLLQFRGERNAYDEIDFDSMTIEAVDAIRTYHEAAQKDIGVSQHLILVLDRRLQAFPWESLPCLEGSSVSRVGSMLSLRDCILSMRQSIGPGSGAKDHSDICHMVPRNSGTFILNPSSDLSATQTMLQPSLAALEQPAGVQWSSIINKAPSEDDFSSALTTSSVTLYFGHGAGSQYIRPRTIKRLERCSEVVWLMGCSSGSVWENGDLEPCAVPLAYLLAGDQEERGNAGKPSCEDRPKKCLSIVSTLWDVTDKDIDRFSLAVGEEWGLWPASAESRLLTKAPKKREVVAHPSTPVQAPKIPKTPKARKTPAITKTPGIIRSRPQRDESRKFSLVDAVARSREVCTLRYLNGAAPVVYGVPVYLET